MKALTNMINARKEFLNLSIDTIAGKNLTSKQHAKFRLENDALLALNITASTVAGIVIGKTVIAGITIGAITYVATNFLSANMITKRIQKCK